MFVPDFGGSSVVIQDAYVNYRFKPWLQLRAGKFKVPVGLEELQSDPVTFFNERALPTTLLPNRDIGFQLWSNVPDGRLSYAAGVFNGVGDGRSTGNSDFEDHREIAARVFLQPRFQPPRFRNPESPRERFETRNWIVQKFPEDVVMMYDDDVTGCRTLCGLRNRELTPVETAPMPIWLR